jgi:hypothetical protein
VTRKTPAKALVRHAARQDCDPCGRRDGKDDTPDEHAQTSAPTDMTNGVSSITLCAKPMLRLKDMEELSALCDRLFRDENNVARFLTMMMIKTAKEETAVRV